MKRFISWIILIALLSQSFFGIALYAADIDGSARLDLDLGVSVDSDSIVGRNFSLNIRLENLLTSEGDAYNAGFIIELPDLINFVSSSGLGSPKRTLDITGDTKLLFFKNEEIIPKGTHKNYTLSFSSDTNIELFTLQDIRVLGYAEDNIYGTGSPPTGSPGGTLFGGIDFAESVYISTPINFPANILTGTGIVGLPFQTAQTQFIPFNIEKKGQSELKIGEIQEITLRITGNDLGALKDFYLQDVIPNTQKFIGFTQTTGVGSPSIIYNTPSSGNVTLDFKNIYVGTGAVLDIKYQTQALAFPAASYTGSTVLLNTGSYISHNTASVNTVTMMGTGTWNNGISDIPVDGNSLIAPKTLSSSLVYSKMSKTVNNGSPEISDTLRYTLKLDVAKNIALNTSNSGTYIQDILPDGLSYLSTISSTNTGSGSALVFQNATVNANGDTTVTWFLPSGRVEAGDTLTIIYDVSLDASFEGAGITEYRNTQVLTNTANFYGNIAESGVIKEWGFTESSIIDTVHQNTASRNIAAPSPKQQKHLVSIQTPDATIYNAGNLLPLGFGIPVGSKLDFVVSMDFPGANFSQAILKDALPLITGPNTSVSNIVFQTNPLLRDISGALVPFNDDDNDGTADTLFNGLSLGGTTPASSAWITPTAPNNLEFDLGSGPGGKTFALRFSVDVLPVAPSSPGVPTLSIKNVLIGQTQNSLGSIASLGTQNIPFTLGFPVVEVQKETVPLTFTGVSYGKEVDYRVILKNTGSSDAFLENIIDILPVHMQFQSFSMVYSGALNTSVSGATMVQSGTGLSVSFDTQAPLSRSLLSLDNPATVGTDESTIIINYTVAPDQNFLIIPGEARSNTFALDYYSTSDAVSNEVNKIDTVQDTASFTVASPSISRVLLSSSEIDSTGSILFSGEEAIFRTTLTLPAGTYLTGSFTENIRTSNFTFLSGAIFSQGPNISIATGTGFVGNVMALGTIVNSGTGSETIVIDTTSRARKDVARRNNNTAQGEFRYNGATLQLNTPVDHRIPTLNFTKTVSPGSGDSSQSFTYTLSLSHNASSNAPAYDIVLRDILPASVNYVAGTFTGALGFIGTDTEFFSASGITLSSLSLGNTRSVQFQATLGSGALAGMVQTNTGVLFYSSIDDDESILESNYSATGSVGINVSNLAISHTIADTSHSGTQMNRFNPLYPDITLGEEVSYDIAVTLPKLLVAGVKVQQQLPVGMSFLTGSIITDGVKNHTLSFISISPENIIEFDFGDVDNIGVGSGTGFMLRTIARLKDIPANTSGNIINSQAKVTYDISKSQTNISPNFEIVEPTLSVTKSFATGSSLPGKTLLTTIKLENTGITSLYDITWSDVLPPKTSSSGAYVSSGSTGVLLPGQSYIYVYDTLLDNTVIYGETLSGSLTSTGFSLPGVAAERRFYTNTDLEAVSVLGVNGISKVLTASTNLPIGANTSYTLRIPVSEGSTSNIVVNDLIPAGFQIIPSSISLTQSGGVSYSNTITPTISGVSIGTAQSVKYQFLDLENTNNSPGVNEFITLKYDVVVLNTSDNNLGNTKKEAVQVNYSSGASILSALPNDATITEPLVSVNIDTVYTYGNTGSLVFTLTNTGTSTAYDTKFDIDLPAGLTFTGSSTLTNSGGAVGFSYALGQVSLTQLPVNTGNPLQFSFNFVIDNTVASLSSLQTDTHLEYTSLAGSYSGVVVNSNNTERTGTSLGENDYTRDDMKSFTVRLPILKSSLSVRDLNLTPSIVGDNFEYTLTLTNTGHVDLTGIQVLSNISGSFTGFTLISFPAGATDLSSATGGLASAGYVDIQDISIAIGQTVNLVFQVQSLTSLPTQTLINTNLSISKSTQGSAAKTESVTITLLAGKIRLTKTISEPSLNLLLKAGDTIQYLFELKNIGDVPLSDIILDDPILGGNITSSCVFPTQSGSLNLSEVANCTPNLYSVSVQDVLNRKIINLATIESQDQSLNELTATGTLTITFRSIGGGATGGNNSSTVKDSCPNGDLSGNFYDRLCSKQELPIKPQEVKETPIPPTIPDIQKPQLPPPAEIEKKDPKGNIYFLKDDFSTCPIIDDINNDTYEFPRSGVFSDESTSLNKDLILKFAKIGIIDGYDDDTVRPERKMTRAEFLKVALISHCYRYRELSGTSKYNDLEVGTWQSKVVEKSEALGMINGYSDGTFQPNKEISKAEAIKILMRLSFIYTKKPVSLSYQDINVSWHKAYIETGETLGLFDSQKDNYAFYPDSSVERQNMVDLINRLVRLYR